MIRKKPKTAAKRPIPNRPLSPVPPTSDTATVPTPSRIVNPLLPLLWVDNIEVAIRSDGTATLRCFSMTPEFVSEMVRFQISVGHLKGLVDSIAKVLNHYPKPPDLTPVSDNAG